MSDFNITFDAHYGENIFRAGADDLLKWLKSTDFYTAPASTKYHLAREGGLLEHSINVHNRLKSLVANEYGAVPPYTDETIAICALLHDLCKADFYKIEMRNAKNEVGQWVKVPYYTVDDQLPYGHGEKSVYIIGAFMRLEREEAMAIRWHMGGFDDSLKGGGYAMSGAFTKYPLALLLHMADLQATYLDEKE
ncbi:MAG: hypothetical protein LBV12_03205 [Puniceicoccales bacterium]|jgi:hypothetical protein|nr:hypothetical protein [Puniceicoccales bacterium]